MTVYAIDTSAWWIATRHEPSRKKFSAAVMSGSLRMSDPARMEVLYSTRSSPEFERLRADMSQIETADVTPATWRRALDVYEALAHEGGSHHRQVGHMHLLIAAAAEQAGATLLHYDSDFDVIAEITGQPTEWIAPRGSI